MTFTRYRLSVSSAASSPQPPPAEGETTLLSLEHLRAAWDVAAVPMMITRVEDGQVRYANEIAAEMLETTVPELTGERIHRYYRPTENRAELLNALQEQGLLKGQRIEGQTHRGRPFVVRANLQVVLFDNEPCTLSTYQDITEEEAARNNLVQENELLSLANSGAQLSCWSWDPETDEVWWDDYHYDLFEIPRGAPVTSKLFLSRVKDQDRGRVEQQKEHPLFVEVHTIEYELDLPSGRRCVIRDHARLLKRGSQKLILGTSQDITRDVEAQEYLQERLELMQMASQLARFGTWAQVPEGGEDWDPALRKLLQIREGEPTGFAKLMERFHPEEAAEQTQRIQAADAQARSGGLATGIYRFLLPDGTERFLQDHVGSYLKNGERRLIGVIQDVTAQELTRRALQQEMEMRLLTSEGVSLCHWTWDAESNESWWDALHYKLFEVELGTPIRAETFLSRVHPRDRERVNEKMRAAATGRSYSIEYELLLPSGQRRVMRDHSRFVKIGRRLKVVGASQDITQDVLLREALEEKLALMNMASEIAKLGFWSEGPEQTEWWSDSLGDLLQRQAGEPESLATFQSRFHPDVKAAQVAESEQADRRALTGESQVNLYHLKLPDQSERLVRGYVGRLDQEGAQRLLGVVHDVTAQEQQRLQLEQELELHRIANQAAKIGYFRRDPETNQTWMDSYLRQLFELPGRGWFDSDLAKERLTAESRAKLQQAREEIIVSGFTELELKLKLPSGEQRILRSHQRLYAEQGKTWVLGISQDITEIVKVWEVIRRNERLYAVGQLAASVNHDLRQPLAILNIELGLLSRKLNSKPFAEFQEHVAAAQSALQHAGSIMDRPVGLGLDQERQPVPLSEVVQQTLKLMSNLLDQQGLRVRFLNHWEAEPAEEPRVLMQATELMLVLQNLVINARDALTARRQETGDWKGATELWIELQPEAPQSVRLSVVDQGSGIPEALLSEVFKPLFSTKSSHKSTGLGLAICQQIIQEHQGRIWAEPGPQGVGTAFHIELPAGSTDPD